MNKNNKSETLKRKDQSGLFFFIILSVLSKLALCAIGFMPSINLFIEVFLFITLALSSSLLDFSITALLDMNYDFLEKFYRFLSNNS